MILLDTRQLARDIHRLLRYSVEYTRTGQIISNTLTEETKDYVKNRYPLSKHWAPDKIVNGPTGNDWGSVDVNIEGANRAYEEVQIMPNGKWLTIPLHKSAYGKTAREFKGLFKPKGKNILAQVINGSLVAIFALVKRVVQKIDKALLPSDEHYSNSIEKVWIQEFFKTADKEASLMMK